LNNPGTSQSTQRFNSFDSSIPLAPVQDRKLEDESGQSNNLNVTLFDMATIAFSTDNFAAWTKLGEGGFGAVYKVKTNFSSSKTCKKHVALNYEVNSFT
jgi:hypothetical protein